MEYIEDCNTLVSQIKQQDKELRLKRRWLMDLDFTPSEAKKLKQLVPPKDMFVPESLMRGDDVHYEDIKARIEMGFLGGFSQNKISDNQNDEEEEEEKDDEDESYLQLFNSRKGLKDILSILDEMTNKGLCCFAEILTGGSIKFEKTNWQMKKLIKEYLPAVLKNQKDDHWQKKIVQLSQIFSDPRHFHRNYMAHSTPFKFYRAAATRVLNELHDFPFQTLSSMHRKIRGVTGYIPQMQPPKSGWGRGVLTKHVRRSCIELLSELGEVDEPPEPLANALAVAVLTLKLKAKPPPMIEFRKFSPETEALQNEIVKAIQILDGNKKVSFTELKDLLLLLDPNAKSTKRIRIAIRNLLIEYLLECADMETIPECLLEALTIINKRAKTLTSSSFSKEELDKEVECVFTVSAQTKQIVWDLLSECGHEFDLEFTDAYMDDMIESDDDGFDSEDDHQELNLPKNCTDQIESVAETDPFAFESPITATCLPFRRSAIKVEDVHFTEMDSVASGSFLHSSSFTESKVFDSTMQRDHYIVGSMGKLESSDLDHNQHPRSNGAELGGGEASSCSGKTLKRTFSESLCGETDDKPKMKRNQYLAIQEACDRTSMVAYHLVGRTLKELAQEQSLKLDGDDISYLQGKGCEASSKRQTSSDDNVQGSIFLRVLDDLSQEEIIHPFPDSKREKLKELMGIK